MPLVLPVKEMKAGLYTDKYFLRSKQILEAEGINPLVRYQEFTRRDGTVKGMGESIDYIRAMVGDKATIYALRDGDSFQSGEPLMKLEGRIQDLVVLETGYLQPLSAALTGLIDMNEVKENTKAIADAAQGKLLIYMGARHYHWSVDEEIAGNCKDAGFSSCSTDIGSRASGKKGGGTTPHALILTYAAHMLENGLQGNPSVEAIKGFDKYIDSAVERILLCDTFNREIDDSIAAAEAVPSLAKVRIDTCGENYSQGVREIVLPELNVPEKYLRGRGVTIASVWALRRGLDEAGHGNLEIVVSSGFNAEKIHTFVEADKVFQRGYDKPLFNIIGTGSVVENATYATSDICAYFSEKQGLWVPLSKSGRGEKSSDRLVRV